MSMSILYVTIPLPWVLLILAVMLAAVIIVAKRFIKCGEQLSDKHLLRAELFESALESLTEALVVVDERNKFLYANNSAENIFPELKGLEEGAKLDQLKSWPKELSFDSSVIPKVSFDIAQSETKKRYYDASISLIPVDKNKLNGYIIIIRDVTENYMAMGKLNEMAHIDPLTGAYNRRGFIQLAEPQFNKCKKEKSPCAVLMIDLDHFKNCNDTYGHQAGDVVLKTTSELIKHSTRGTDIFARYGGEEFVMFINADSGIVQTLAERMRSRVEGNPSVHEGTTIGITCSIGIAMCTKSNTLEETIGLADTALYRAKNNGRNQVVLYS